MVRVEARAEESRDVVGNLRRAAIRRRYVEDDLDSAPLHLAVKDEHTVVEYRGDEDDVVVLGEHIRAGQNVVEQTLNRHRIAHLEPREHAHRVKTAVPASEGRRYEYLPADLVGVGDEILVYRLGRRVDYQTRRDISVREAVEQRRRYRDVVFDKLGVHRRLLVALDYVRAHI